MSSIAFIVQLCRVISGMLRRKKLFVFAVSQSDADKHETKTILDDKLLMQSAVCRYYHRLFQYRPIVMGGTNKFSDEAEMSIGSKIFRSNPVGSGSVLNPRISRMSGQIRIRTRCFEET